MISDYYGGAMVNSKWFRLENYWCNLSAHSSYSIEYDALNNDVFLKIIVWRDWYQTLFEREHIQNFLVSLIVKGFNKI